MDNDSYVVVKKKNTVWKVLGIILAIGAICVVAAQVYRRFFKKKQEAVCESEELDALETAEEACEEAEEEALIADAESVIADAENMEETAN